MKVVLDVNVILSAFATRGLCEAVMSLCLDRHTIVLCEPMLAAGKTVDDMVLGAAGARPASPADRASRPPAAASGTMCRMTVP